ncbi:MAG: hypothetical protein ABIO67_07240 [Mycobacteriales bacterium]
MRTVLVRLAALGVGLAVIVALIAAGHPVVTKARLEQALTPTFSRLYVEQSVILGRSNVTVASVGARTACDRGGPRVADVGPGSDWICFIDWTDGAGKKQHGKFEIQAKSNACYVATGPSRINGPVMIGDVRIGRDVLNPVFEWDGCYSPTS